MIPPNDQAALAAFQASAAARGPETAIDGHKACVALDPAQPALYLQLADSFADRGYLGHARENYRRCEALLPTDSVSVIRLVRLEFRLGLYDECVATGRRLFDRGTIDGNTLFYIASSLHYMGDHGGARRILGRFDPNSASVGFINYFLARCAYAGNDTVGALAHLGSAAATMEDGAVRLLLNRVSAMAGLDLDTHAANAPFAKQHLDAAAGYTATDLRQAAMALRSAVYAAPWSTQVDARIDAFRALLSERIASSSDAEQRTSLWHVMEGMEAEREFARTAVLPPPKPGGLLKAPRRVFDGFIFNDELDLLAYRLEEIGSVVDAIVVVESEWTFQGARKPLIFQENSARFARFADKIVHVVVRNHCAGLAWDHEAYQRNMILHGLRGCREDDIVLISDVDEIPRKSTILHLKTAELKHNDIHALSFRYFRYFLNTRLPLMWMRPVALPYGLLARIGPNRARELMIKSEPPIPNVIHDAGWHFSSLGGVEAQLKKYRENSHIEIAERQPSRDKLELAYTTGRFEDEWGRLRMEPIDGSYPNFVLANREDLIAKGWIWNGGR